MTWGISKGLEQLDRDTMMSNHPWNPDAPNFTDGPLSTAQAEGTSQAPQEETGMDRGRLLIAASMINNEQFSKLEFELRMSSKSYGRKTFW